MGTGCSSGTKQWKVELQAASTTNGSRPVVVRLYQLKGKGKFQQATYDQLSDHDREVLGNDWVDQDVRDEVTIYPNCKLHLHPIQVKKEALYIGIVALFSHPRPEGWKQIVEAQSSVWKITTPIVKIHLEKSAIRLADERCE